jgi:hypothetical protein
MIKWHSTVYLCASSSMAYIDMLDTPYIESISINPDYAIRIISDTPGVKKMAWPKNCRFYGDVVPTTLNFENKDDMYLLTFFKKDDTIYAYYPIYFPKGQ